MRVLKKLQWSLRSFIGRPGLIAARCCGPERSVCSSPPPQDAALGRSMLKHLASKIKATGPISVAEYMREVLTNPLSGYYVRNDMLGIEGDFVTSPEISQIFGELLGIWCVSEWMAAGKPKQFQLVELGPGRGSLVADVLRVFSQLRAVLSGTSVSVHLVEISPKLSQVQAQSLTGELNQVSSDESSPVYRQGTTTTGLPVRWYRRVEDIPEGFSIFLAHEFFDALPIHKFQRTAQGWREVMVDIVTEEPDKLRFVLVPAPTLASSVLLQVDEKRVHVEVCPEGGVTIQRLSNRIAEHGGAALIADYGHDGTKTDTFRGFRRHQLHDVLSAPGMADLTADVDFSYLRRMAGDKVACFGPITQRQFLQNMGIDVRLQVLLRSCQDAPTRTQLIHGFDMLMNPKKMGECFKFFALLAHSRLAHPADSQGTAKKAPAPLPVAGFTELGPVEGRS